MEQWHGMDADSAIKKQETGESGLSSGEVSARLQKYGKNEFQKKKSQSLAVRILKQFKDVSVIILIIAGLLSLVMTVAEGGNPLEPIVIFVIVAMNAALAVTQERSAEKALDALGNMSQPTCFVIRDGERTEISPSEVVPGDILYLKTGNMVAADARLVSSSSLQIDEASLTGESVPSEKDAQAVLREDAPLGDRVNMVFSGCLVTVGHGTAVVTGTGMNTQIGKIAGYLNEAGEGKTPLQKRLNRVGKIVSGIAVAAAVMLIIIGLANGEARTDPWGLIMLAVTLGVAAVPETLMLIVTLTLTHGVKTMAGKNALIRKLQAVETLGSTAIICSDKTGTLTQNKMTVKRLWLLDAAPISETESFSNAQTELLKRYALASTASVSIKDGKAEIIGDPTETAIMRLLLDKGIDKDDLYAQYKKVAEIPFSSSRKMMTVALKKPDGGYLVLTKGAFDRIPFDRDDLVLQKKLEDMHNSFAADALRVITLASREIEALPESESELECGLIFEGFIGIIDPPRLDAAIAVAKAKKAGIRTIMITGDHAATAGAIAKELGIIAAREGIITGEELNKLSDDEFEESIEFYSVYARVSPEDKIRIVRAWQKRGSVVSMTGDGVNDAPALKAADVGVAMGISGTEVAKSAADVILTDDKFSTIVDAVAEGRNVFSNIRKLVYFLIVCNISEIIVMLFAKLIGWGALVTPMMLLIINVLGDGIPGLGLAREQSDPRIMARKPIGKEEGFFSGGLMEAIIQQTVACSFVILAGFYVGANVRLFGSVAPSPAVGQTMAFLLLGWTSIIHIFTVRSRKSVFKRKQTDNPQILISAAGMILVLLLLTAIPPLANALGFAVMSPLHWLITVVLSVIPLAAAEYKKLWDNYRLRSEDSKRVA